MFLVCFSCFERCLLFFINYVIAYWKDKMFFILRASFEKQAFWKRLPLYETCFVLHYNDRQARMRPAEHAASWVSEQCRLLVSQELRTPPRETSWKARKLLYAPWTYMEAKEYSLLLGSWMAGSHLEFRWGLQSTFSNTQTFSWVLNENV